MGEAGNAGGADADRAARRPRGSSCARYLPHVVLATAFVVVLPAAIAGLLQARGILTSAALCVLVAVALSVAAAYLAGAAWQRGRRAGDLLFSELLAWGWIRRLRVERRLRDIVGLLDGGDHAPAPGRLTAAQTEERRQHLVRLQAALETQDPDTAGHARRVARHAQLIGRQLGLAHDDITRLVAAAAIHDVGKLYVPLEVLHKPGRLTEEEFALIRRHPEDGADLVAALGDEELTAIIRHHHERFDGGGYPGGLRGAGIPLGARIVAVADTFDAITAARPYRGPATHKRALDVLVSESGAQFDPVVAGAFVAAYRSRGSVVPWATLGALGAAVPWQRGLRPVARLPSLAGVAVLAVLVLLAVGRPAAPLAGTPGQTHRAAGTVRPVVGRRIPVDRAVHGVRTTAVPASPTSTCQAYAPQTCLPLIHINQLSGAAAGGGAGSAAGRLPFTG